MSVETRSPARLPSEKREKALRLALHRIQRGRALSGAKRITFEAVAREAGVSAALIHNHYPQVAEAIRVAQGKDSRRQRDDKRDELKAAKAESKALRSEIERIREQRRTLISINENLRQELAILRAATLDPVVVPIAGRPKKR